MRSSLVSAIVPSGRYPYECGALFIDAKAFQSLRFDKREDVPHFFMGIIAFLICGLLVYLFLNKQEDNRGFVDDWKKLIIHSDLDWEFEEYYKANVQKMGEYNVYKSFLTPERQKHLLDYTKEREKEKEIEIERHRRDVIPKRVYAYPYEDFIYSVFAPYAHYDTIMKIWTMGASNRVSVPKDIVMDKIKVHFNLSDSDASQLFSDFVKNGLIQNSSQDQSKVYLGGTLYYDANIISSEDMNLDKWVKTNSLQS